MPPAAAGTAPPDRAPGIRAGSCTAPASSDPPGTPLPEITATEGSVTIRIRPAHDYLKVLKSIDSTEVADNRSPREVAYFRMKDVLNKELKEREKRIILPIVEYFAEHDEISTEYASVLIGKSLTTAWRYLNRMKELGLLEQIGKSHSSKYVFVF